MKASLAIISPRKKASIASTTRHRTSLAIAFNERSSSTTIHPVPRVKCSAASTAACRSRPVDEDGDDMESGNQAVASSPRSQFQDEAADQSEVESTVSSEETDQQADEPIDDESDDRSGNGAVDQPIDDESVDRSGNGSVDQSGNGVVDRSENGAVDQSKYEADGQLENEPGASPEEIERPEYEPITPPRAVNQSMEEHQPSSEESDPIENEAAFSPQPTDRSMDEQFHSSQDSIEFLGCYQMDHEEWEKRFGRLRWTPIPPRDRARRFFKSGSPAQKLAKYREEIKAMKKGFEKFGKVRINAKVSKYTWKKTPRQREMFFQNDTESSLFE